MSYLDIYWAARTNQGGFRNKLEHIIKDIQLLERSDGTPNKRELMGEKLWAMHTICQGNIGFMIPWFFPKLISNAEMTLSRRPFGFALFDMLWGGSTTVRGSRQIAKSSNFIARQLINQHMLPGWRSIYIVPHTEMRNTYANKMRETENGFRYFIKRHDIRQNLFYKESSNKNNATIELCHVFSTAAHMRGKSADELIFDEYQLFDVHYLPDLEQIQKASENPTTLFGGTSTSLDSPLEAQFQEGSQGTWNILSPDGKHWIDCGDKDQILKIIRPEGPTCFHTGRPLDVTNGRWVHHQERQLMSHQISLHVPQLIIPDYATNYKDWALIYQQFQRYDEAKFLQEVCGIPVAEGARELTEADMQNICVLGNKEALEHRAKKLRPYKFLISGCDWGGSDYQPAFKTKKSFTVHTVLGVYANGDFDILHMRRYAGMGYDEIVHSIVRDHRRYGCTAIASDFGVGMAYNGVIRQNLPADRHIIFEYIGPNHPVLSTPQYPMFNHFLLNKTEATTMTIQGFKRKPAPRIRCFDWSDARDYLMDCVNLYRVPVESVNSGRSQFKFIRNPTKTDDTFHSISFAYTLGRIMLGEPVFEDLGLKGILEARLGMSSHRTNVFGNFGVISG